MSLREDNARLRMRLKELLEIIDPFEKDGDALVDITEWSRPEMQAWLVRLKEQYTEWEAPDGWWGGH